jgi:peptide/nickel transport system permease protein
MEAIDYLPEKKNGSMLSSVFTKVVRFPYNPVIPIIYVLLVVFVAIFATAISPYPPNEGNLADKLTPPAFAEEGDTDHFLGTDRFGRDSFSRIIHGARVSLAVAIVAIAIGATIGTLVGITAGYYGGKIDAILMRLVDIGLSIPVMLVALVLAAAIGPSFRNVILIIGLLLWTRFARQIRGEVLSVKEQDYVARARVAGASARRIMFKHLFPNIVPTLLVMCTLEIGHVVLVEASLSFLGVGVPAPTPTWGGMVSEGRGLISSAWWVALFPGLAILLLVLSMNFFGDWVRDRLDPKLRQL